MSIISTVPGEVIWDSKCFRLHKNGRKCTALKVDHCDPNCNSRMDNPFRYVEELEDMLRYNKENPTSCADLRKQIIAVRRKYKIYNVDVKPGTGDYEGWRDCYQEDLRRGSGGGGSSDKDANAATSAKQKMKDNRPQDCKLTAAERQKIKEETEKWEAEHGKLDKLSRNPLSRNKIDSYTGEPI